MEIYTKLFRVIVVMRHAMSDRNHDNNLIDKDLLTIFVMTIA